MKLLREVVNRLEVVTPIEPDAEHHGALTKIGLKHLSSDQTYTRDEDGKMRGYEHHHWAVEHAAKWDEWTGRKSNVESKRTIEGVKKHFASRGFRHVAARGNMGIHWFSRKTPEEKKDPFSHATESARMDTKRGQIYLTLTKRL